VLLVLIKIDLAW